MESKLIPDDVRRSLDGDEVALSQLVDTLTPVIQARVARTLLLRRPCMAAGRNARQEVEDIVQDIFLVLFDNDGEVLRGWRPERGLSLHNYVGLVAERRATSILRSGKRSPWKEEPTLTEDLDREAPATGPEQVTASREKLRLLLDRLKEELSPQGRHLFDLLFLRELSVAEAVGETGMSSDAVYAWRSRLVRLAKKIWGNLSDQDDRERRPPMGR